jgi:hypothetical protein
MLAPLLGLVEAIQDPEQECRFVLEVDVDGAVSHSSLSGDSADRGRLEAPGGENLGSGIEDVVTPHGCQAFCQPTIVGGARLVTTRREEDPVAASQSRTWRSRVPVRVASSALVLGPVLASSLNRPRSGRSAESVVRN